MGTLTVGVEKSAPSSASTADKSASEQTENSAFLTVESFTNFSAATGAITTAWLALQALDQNRFDDRLWPFLMSIAWLVFSLVLGVTSVSSDTDRTKFWVSGVFLGFFNALTLFAAVVGVHASVT